MIAGPMVVFLDHEMTLILRAEPGAVQTDDRNSQLWASCRLYRPDSFSRNIDSMVL